MKQLRVYRTAIVLLSIALLAETAWIVWALRPEPVPQEESWDFAYDGELSASFERALSDGSIEVWFQPIADAGTGETAGAEALSRWKEKDEYISPSVFVATLEATGQVTELDRNVFRKACLFQKARLDAGESLFPISVNLSVLSSMQEGIAGEYAELLASEGLPAGCINVEVTETLDSDREALAEVVRAFQAEGFHVEIDDFGAGYAALENLAVIPYDVLKIDKSLVDHIGTERGDVLLADILGLAKGFGMTVIAEGVETQEQADFLRDAGCGAIQGYYYAKPMPEADFIDFLAAQE